MFVTSLKEDDFNDLQMVLRNMKTGELPS
jgi:hypothetical protein